MDVDCAGCAGCCLDWRPLADGSLDHERRGPYEPLDDIYNFVPLDREEIRQFIERGLADVLVPRLWAPAEAGITIGDVELAAIDGQPAFLVGLRTVPKPVGPFGHDPTWLSTCIFLDPATLRCRIHGTTLYPSTCETYPGANLVVDAETECERVEREHGGRRLLDRQPPPDAQPLFGSGALGTKVFVHPEPDRIATSIPRVVTGNATAADRAEFSAVAAAASPGTLEIEDAYYEQSREAAVAADSWVGGAIADWRHLAGLDPDPQLVASIEVARGAPETTGWEERDD